MNGIYRNILLLALSFCFFACQPTNTNDQPSSNVKKAIKDQLNLYTYRYYKEDQALLQQFEERYNTTVNITQASNEELLAKLIAEKGTRQADVVLFEDVSYFKKAQEEGLLQPFSSEQIEKNVPTAYEDKNGYWVGVSKNFMGFVYPKQQVDPTTLPMPGKKIDKAWANQLVLPANQVIAQDLVAKLLTQSPATQVNSWMSNYARYAVDSMALSDYETIELVGSGKAKAGLISAASLVQYQMSGDPQQFKMAEKLGFEFVSTKDGKTYGHLSGLGVANGTPRWRDALLLIGFLTDTNIQEQYNNALKLYSVNVMALPSDFLIELGGFQEGKIDYDIAWQQWEKAEAMLEKNNWK